MLCYYFLHKKVEVIYILILTFSVEIVILTIYDLKNKSEVRDPNIDKLDENMDQKIRYGSVVLAIFLFCLVLYTFYHKGYF